MLYRPIMKMQNDAFMHFSLQVHSAQSGIFCDTDPIYNTWFLLHCVYILSE